MALWGQVIVFGVLVIAVIVTINAYRSLPVLLVLLVGLTALLGWITTSTPFGRSLFAVGGNPESARRVGMNVKRIRVAAFGIVGLMAAVGGIFGASRFGSVSYTAFAGGSLLLEAIGAAVIGGTSAVWWARLGLERDSGCPGHWLARQWSRPDRCQRRRQADGVGGDPAGRRCH